MDTLYTFWDNIAHYKTESVDFLGLMNSATKRKMKRLRSRGKQVREHETTGTKEARNISQPSSCNGLECPSRERSGYLTSPQRLLSFKRVVANLLRVIEKPAPASKSRWPATGRSRSFSADSMVERMESLSTFNSRSILQQVY